jgi:hypothetical protein
MKPKIYVAAHTSEKVDELSSSLLQIGYEKPDVALVEYTLFEDMMKAWYDKQPTTMMDGREVTQGFPMAIIPLDDEWKELAKKMQKAFPEKKIIE